MEMIVISLCLTTFLAIFFLKKILKRTTKLNLPPSPWRLPIIGNLHQLSLQPHLSIGSLSLRYGPLMLLHFGSVPIVVASSADFVHDIMKTHDIKFANRPKSKAIEIYMDGGRDLIFAPYGESWKHKKSLCVVHLFNDKMVRSFEHVRESEIQMLTEKLEEACSSSTSVDLSKIFLSLTNDVVCKSALGRKYVTEDSGIELRNLVKTTSALFGKVFVGQFIPCLEWVDNIRGLYDTMRDLSDKVDGFLDKVVQEHIDSGDHEERADFVNILLSIQKDETKRFDLDRTELKLILKDMFLGGTLTSSTLLEWTMTELMRHPDCMKKLRDEIVSVSTHNSNVTEKEVEQMYYLNDVMKEALRLHPSAPLSHRRLSEDVQLKGYDIAAGTHVVLNIRTIQRDPATWGPDAEEFRPERHSESNVTFYGSDFKYIPFGAGRRLCPAIKFASIFVKLTIANVVKRFNLRVEAGPTGDDKPDLFEAYGVDVCRKFPLIVFPSIVDE